MGEQAKYSFTKDQIEQLILTGKVPVGGRLPSENDLAEWYNVSRGTVRQALASLASDGIISRQSGSGTYVSRLPGKVAGILSFSEQIKQSGRALETRVLAAERITAGQIRAGEREWLIKAFVSVENGHGLELPIYRIERLRLVDGRPASWQELYLPAKDFRPDLLEVDDFSKSAFEIYRKYGRIIKWAEESIQAAWAPAKVAQLLEMTDIQRKEQFVYARRRVSFDNENLPVEAVISIERHDCFGAYRYRFVESREEYVGQKRGVASPGW